MENNQLWVILFCSRNKDNRDILGFKQRRQSFVISDRLDNTVMDKFFTFRDNGVDGELSRAYISLNSYSQATVQKALQHYLLDNDIDLSKIDSTIASLTAKSPSITKRWLLDYDGDMNLFDDFINDVKEIVKDDFQYSNKTIIGGAVVTERGFDTRELLEKWKDVELKRTDAMELFYYSTK